MIFDVENIVFLTLRLAFPIFAPPTAGQFGGRLGRHAPYSFTLSRGVYGSAGAGEQEQGVLSRYLVQRLRPVPAGHPENPAHQRPRGGAGPRAASPRRRSPVRRATGDGQSPLRHLLREEVPGPR